MTHEFINPNAIKAFFRGIAICILVLAGINTQAQVTVTGGYTAAQMAAKLAGPGVSVFGATLTCPADAYGQFVTTASTLGLDSGIVLTCGTAVTTASVVGVNITNTDTAGAFTNFANTDNSSSSTGGAGDADLTTLAGLPTYDACVLEFNFKPAGDTVKFKYVFGSEEYTLYTCTTFNDVFGFLISGGAYGTPTNIARVPGTTIPVCINSVNCGATGSGVISNCTALGSGSPFCAYYVANGTGTTITYDGLTTPLYAIARVSPCDTYHLKLGIADASDHALDSGVFLEAGSLTSNSAVSVTSFGVTGGAAECVRGCLPATFRFSTGVTHDTAIKVLFSISGTAVNGTDYSYIPDSAILAPYTSTTDVTIVPLPSASSGVKTVIVSILIPDPCHPGVYVIGATASIDIYDSFRVNIVTPDTEICNGQIVNAIATGDPVFGSLLTYAWTPTAAIGAGATSLTPTLTPTVTTTYTLTATLGGTAGCPPKTREITVAVYTPTFDSVTFNNPTVCGYTDGTITLHGLQTGYLDTLHYTVNGIPHAPVPIGVSSAHTAVITGLGAGVYSNVWVKVGLCPTLTRGPVTLVDPAPPVVSVDSHYVKTCVGQSTLLHSYVTPTGIAMNYTWTPPTDLSTATAANTIVTPTVAGDVTYTITVNPGTNPSCNSTDTIHVHTLAPFVLHNRDTIICISRFVQVNITGSNEYAYVWTPVTGVSNPNIKNPQITPPLSSEYIVKASYANCPDQLDSFHIEVDTPATPRNIVDTICIGMSDNFDFTVPGTAGTSAYTYSWTTAIMADLSNPSIANPVITPSTIGSNFYTLTVSPAARNCSVTDNVTIFVIDTTISVRPVDTGICLGKVVQVVGNGDPLFSYQWLPTAGIAVSNVLNALITPDTSALYVVTATFGRCPPIHATSNIRVEPNPVVYAGGNTLLCAYDTLHVHASVTPSWYTGYIYSWTPPADLDNTTTATVVYSGAASTDLYVTVSTPAGCKSNDSAHITVFPGNFATITPDHYSFCPHDTAVPTVNITAGVGASYHWSPAMYLDDSTSSAPVIRPVSTQNYTIVVTTINGCKDTLHYYATVFPAALISIPDSVVLYPGESYQIDPLTNCNSFKWFPPAGLNADNVSNPLATPDISTRYIVNGTTSDGCKSTDSIDIIVNPDGLLVLPNAFTPGTGANNEFKIIKRGIATLNYFRIFNRWGNLLFETNNIDKGWDGTYNGQPQPLAVYVYEVQAVTSSGAIFNKKGNVTIIR